MFKKGDLVMHPAYGAGEVLEIKTMSLTGKEVRYYEIAMIDGDNTVLLPVEEAAQLGLCVLTDSETMLPVLRDAPAHLSDDFKQRKSDIQDKQQSGDPLKIAETVRDLIWRKQDKNLSTTDQTLLSKGMGIISGILAAKRRIKVETASQQIYQMIQQEIEAKAALNAV
jgi:CarD family transcriptional regulator